MSDAASDRDTLWAGACEAWADVADRFQTRSDSCSRMDEEDGQGNNDDSAGADHCDDAQAARDLRRPARHAILIGHATFLCGL